MFAGPKIAPPVEPRVLKCYFEDWEEEHLLRKDEVSKAKFLQKYGGLQFEDIDNFTVYTIHPSELHWQRRSKIERGGWCVKALNNEENEYEPWTIYSEDDTLHDCLCSYYQRHPEKNVKLVCRKGQAEAVAKLYEDALARRRLELEKKKKGSNSPSKKRTDLNRDLGKCGGCGNPVGPVHKCDICGCNMHPFCGKTIGEEGHGSMVRCPSCDTDVRNM